MGSLPSLSDLRDFVRWLLAGRLPCRPPRLGVCRDARRSSCGVPQIAATMKLDVIDARPFTDPAETERDAVIMRDMLERMRVLARGWLGAPPPGPDALVREHDAAGNRTWIRIPDLDALLVAGELTTVGFFGQTRDDVDHDPIHHLEEEIVDTLELVPGVL